MIKVSRLTLLHTLLKDPLTLFFKFSLLYLLECHYYYPKHFALKNLAQLNMKGITGSRLLRLICWIPHRLVLTFNYFFQKRHFPPKNDPIWKIPIGRKLSLCPLYWCMNWSHRECFKKIYFFGKKSKFWKNAIISTKISEPEFFFHLCRVDNVLHVHVQL